MRWLLFTCSVKDFALPIPVLIFTFNTKLNGLRTNILLRKSKVSVERISVCNVIENLVEHGIHCVPCFYTINVMDLLLLQLCCHS